MAQAGDPDVEVADLCTLGHFGAFHRRVREWRGAFFPSESADLGRSVLVGGRTPLPLLQEVASL